MSEPKVAVDPLSVPVSGPLSVTPLYAAGDQIVLWDGSSWNELPGGGSAGPINVTGDVLGSGTGTVPTTVLGLQRRPVSSALPLDGQVLGWSAGQWRPVPAATVTGGGGPPGGATGTVQLNAGGGNFGGITMGGEATWNTSTGALSLSTMPGLAAGTYQGITFDAKGRATTAINMNYAPLADPHFTGVPTAPTAAPGTFSTQLATTAYVDSLYSPGAYIDTNGVLVTLADGVSVNLCQVGLPAGDWIIDGSAYFNTGTALNYNFMAGANTTSATLPSIPYYTQLSPAGAMSGGTWTLNIPERKFTFAVTTTVYLVVRASFGAGSTVTAQGHIAAQQMQKLVTGVGGGGPLVLSGDVSTAGTIATVTGLQGRPIATTLPTDTQVLAWSSGAWRPTAPGGGTGSGTPGPSPGYVQYNAAGAFGGSSGATFSATQLTSLAVGLGGDALGDIYFRNVTGHLQALPAGSPGFLLQMQGGVPTWQSVATGAGTVNPGATPQIAQYQGSNMVGGVTMSGDATIAAGGALTLRSIGTAGTYNNVTTDVNGRVVAGSNVAYLTANQNITLIGDNTGSGSSGNINTTTVGLQTRPVASTAPNNNEVLAWNTTNLRWQPTPASTLGIGGITSITFATPLTGGTISTSGTVGLTVPSANLLGGTGTNFTSVAVGTGLSLSAGTLTATASGGNVTTGTLTTNALTVGTGPQAIATLASLGTATTVLHGNAAGPPTWGPIDLSTAQVTGNLHAANLGNGTGATNLTFWRGDETWATPPGGSGGTVVASTQFQIPYYNIAGSVASVQGHPQITTTTAGSLTINQNSAAALAPQFAGTLLQLVGADTVAQPNLEMIGTTGNNSFVMRRAGGTLASLANTANAAAFLNIQGRGYDTTNGWSTNAVSIQLLTAEAWDATHHGTNIAFVATPVGGSITSAVQMAVTGTGVTIGTPTAAAVPTFGDLNCQRLLVNGSPLSFADTTSGGITAATGAQGAGALTSQLNVVTTVGSGQVVTLPAGTVGGHCLVRNSGANTLTVYPASGATINAQLINTAITVLPNSTAYFEAMSSAQWFTVP